MSEPTDGERSTGGDLFVMQNVRLHSGAESTWKIECDALSDAETATLAYLIAERVGVFSAVEGVPRGGLRLAEHLRSYGSASGPLLIVDDVCTTGASMEQHRQGRDAIGYVLFARGPIPSWAKALFTLDSSHA